MIQQQKYISKLIKDDIYLLTLVAVNLRNPKKIHNKKPKTSKNVNKFENMIFF